MSKPLPLLLNAFSISMVQLPSTVRFEEVSLEEVKQIISEGFISAIGHQGTAQTLSELLGVQVPVNRAQVSLTKGQVAIVFQLMLRLAEGQILSSEEVKQLLAQGKAKFVKVTVLE